MSSLYTEIIQDAYRRPHYRGELPGATHSYEDENPLCGDRLRVDLRIEDGRIADARFTGNGCVISQAAMELLLGRLEGQPLSAVDRLDHRAVLEELGLPTISPARLKCALLSVAVIKGALRHGSRAETDVSPAE